MSQLTVEHLIRVRSIYRTIRRERGDAFASLPRRPDWLTFRYVRPDSVRRLAAITFNDPPVIAIHPSAFEWEHTLLLKGLIHHELCHLLLGPAAGHGSEFQALERGWRSFYPYTVQRSGFARLLTDNAREQGSVFVYRCRNCDDEIIRIRPLKPNSACAVCCKAFNKGKWCESYTFKKVDALG